MDISFCSRINQPVPSGFANTHFTALIMLLSIYYVCQMPEKNKFCKKKNPTIETVLLTLKKSINS